MDDLLDNDKNNVQQSIYVNLAENKESFTAYEGSSIWKVIYDENCQVTTTQLANQGECSEQTLLYQLVSGLHASINTHIADGFEDTSGQQTHNLTYFY